MKNTPHPAACAAGSLLLCLIATGIAFGDDRAEPPSKVRARAVEVEPVEIAPPPEPSPLEEAQIVVSDLVRDAQLTISNLEWPLRAGASARQLILSAPSATPEALTETREDLAVMSRILSRAANPDAARPKGWFDSGRVLRLEGREYDAILLDGYGALFFLGADFPLVPSPSGAPASSDAKPERDTTWERTRRELAGNAPGISPGEDALALHERVFSWTPSVEPYDPGKVAHLRESLNEALQQAANIRALKPEDWVTVVVTGPAPAAPGSVKPKKAEGRPGATPPAPGTGGRSLLTFRVRKSAADDLSAGRITAEDFAKRVEIAERLEPAVTQAPTKARIF